MLEELIIQILPPIISICELMGIFVVAVSALRAMAAEILKTVLVRDLNELIVLGAVVLLRALLSLLIHFEMKEHHT